MESDISSGEMYPSEMCLDSVLHAKQKPASLEDADIEIVFSTVAPGL